LKISFCYAPNRFRQEDSGEREYSIESLKELFAAEKLKNTLLIWFPENAPEAPPYTVIPRPKYFPEYIEGIKNEFHYSTHC
jgi:hypothetical protein